jgi:hypothetical protein
MKKTIYAIPSAFLLLASIATTTKAQNSVSLYSTISGTVWKENMPSDGIRQVNEDGIPGVLVTLLDALSDKVISSAISGTDGSFTLRNYAGVGDYYIKYGYPEAGFALRLAELYRYILDHSLRSDMVSLSEEMNIVYAYLEILDSSHKGNYRLITELTEEAVKSKVLPLSIQGLIENAFKHNIVSAEWPLQLYIFIENDQVVVSNNINRKKYDTIQNQRQGTGLKNLKERYQIIASKAIEVIESDTTFVVKIPLL